MPAGRRRSALKEYIEDDVGALYPILPYDAEAAVWHARERTRLERLGRTPPYVDGQIAAIARTNDLILVTTNTRHFRFFDGLVVEDWSSA